VSRGRGVAFARYENDQGIVACIAEVHVEQDTGVVRVTRVVVAQNVAASASARAGRIVLVCMPKAKRNSGVAEARGLNFSNPSRKVPPETVSGLP
jgi:hypothetical protein